MYKLLGIISRRMRETDTKSVFLSVVGVYVVRTSSLNDKHSCQLFRKAASFSSLVLLSSSVSTANLICLLATTYSSLRFLFNFTSLQSFESGQALFSWLSIFSFSRLILNPQPFFPLFISLWSSVCFKFLISKWTFLFHHAKAALARSRSRRDIPILYITRNLDWTL